MTLVLDQTAQSIAIESSGKVGFNVLPIIELFLPLVLKCSGLTSGQSVHDMALAHYDPSTQDFDEIAYAQLTPRVRLASLRAKRRHKIDELPNAEGIRTIVQTTLRQAIAADVGTLASCVQEAASMDDDPADQAP